MLTKNKIRLFIALGIILIVGFTNTLLNLRPVSERKKHKQEKIDYKQELKNINDKIFSISIKIKNDTSDSKLFLDRARLYKSINKYDKAIVDYNDFIMKTSDDSLKEQAKKELKSCENIKNHLEKNKY